MQDACSRLSTTLSSSQLSPPSLTLETSLIPSHISALLDSAEVNLTTRLSKIAIFPGFQKQLCSKSTNTSIEKVNYAREGKVQGRSRESRRFVQVKGSNHMDKSSLQPIPASQLYLKAKPSKAPKQIKLDLKALTDVSLVPDPYITTSLSHRGPVPVYALNLVSFYRKTSELRPVRSPDLPLSHQTAGNKKRKAPSSSRS